MNAYTRHRLRQAAVRAINDFDPCGELVTVEVNINPTKPNSKHEPTCWKWRVTYQYRTGGPRICLERRGGLFPTQLGRSTDGNISGSTKTIAQAQEQAEYVRKLFDAQVARINAAVIKARDTHQLAWLRRETLAELDKL